MNRENRKIPVLSGIRASHRSLHIGNLFGAIYGMKKLQNDPKYKTYYMVADLHGITEPFIPSELSENRIEIAKEYLSCGIDPNKSILFLQSSVPQHAEFAYYLSSVISVPRVLRVPSFKDLRLKKATFEKFKELIKAVSVARFNYPILMAADILLYKAQKVPIGGDQAAHLEISAEIARKMNKKYKLSLPEPKSFSVIAKDFVLPDLSGKEKMSKSNPEKAIFLNDSRKTIERKIAKITTDTAGKGTKIPESGGVYVLFVFTELFISEKRRKELEKEYLTTGLKYEEIKKEITQAIYKELSLIRKKRKYYDNHPEEVNKILREGARKAEKIASQTLEEVREAMQLA